MPAAVTAPRRMTVIRSAIATTSASLWLMKTIEWPPGRHRPQRPEELFHLLGRKDGGRLVHDQDPHAAVEHLQDLDALLLADRQLPDLGPRIDVQAERLAERRDLAIEAVEVQPEARPARPRRMFSVTVWEGTRVKCWCTIPRPAEIASRGEWKSTGDALDPDRSLVGPVEARQDVHERALAGAVLAEQGVDLAGPQVEVDPVVGERRPGTA